jgi:hypothetical protein
MDSPRSDCLAGMSMNHIVAGSCKEAYIFWIVSYLSVAESDVFHSGDMVVGATDWAP